MKWSTLENCGKAKLRSKCIFFVLQDTSGFPYPVMVYLHGGGYTGSANIQYPGHFQAGHDVVVVVPNYRLGALGAKQFD